MWSDLCQNDTNEKTVSALTKTTQTFMGFHIFNEDNMQTMTEGGGISNWTFCLRRLLEQLIPIFTKQFKSGVCPITDEWLKAALLTIKHTSRKNCVLMRSIVWCAPWLAQKSSLKTCDQELLICIKLGKVTKPSLKVWMFINPQLEKLSTNGESLALLLLSQGVAVHQKWHQEFSTVYSER